MAVTSQSVSITTTRTALSLDPVEDSTYGCTVWLYSENHGSSNKIAIGGSDVTIANGLHIYGGEKFGPITLGHGETLYAISDSAGGLDLRILTLGA